jgi:hypothetical protein
MEDYQILRLKLDELGWTGGMAARRWNVDKRLMRRWLAGEVKIPGPVLRLVELERTMEKIRRMRNERR